MTFKALWEMAKATLSRFMADNAMQMGAALAFYTIFSLAPIIIILLGVVGLVWGEQAAQGEIVEQVEDTVGEEAAGMIETVIQNAGEAGQSIVAIAIGLVVTIIGATGVFAQLKQSLNTMWEVKPKPNQPIGRLIRDRLLSFAMVLTIAFLLLVSLAVSAALSAVTGYMADTLPVPGWLLSLVQYLVSVGVIALLFMVIFKYLPDVEIGWKDVAVGAVVTAILFVIGESLLSMYLAFSSVASSYGAAGSLVALLLWVYYSSLIFLVGAEFTQVYTERIGSGMQPSKRAMPRDAEPEAA